jgi:REP-associated tyrosine transposase
VRKTIEHDNRPREPHELTFSCHDRRPLLLQIDDAMVLFGEAVVASSRRHQFDVIAFVFMPEHVHLLVYSELREYSVSSWLSAIKRPFSFRVKQLIAETNAALLESLTVRERPGKMAFRFWTEGPGYDRNVRDRKTRAEMVRYIHDNPVRRGLCKRVTDWHWSSARQYYEPDWQPPPYLPRVPPIRRGLKPG